MQQGILFLPLLLVAAVANGQQAPADLTPVAQPTSTYPTLGERLRFEMHAATGLGSLASGLASAGIRQWRDTPREWNQGAAGYGRRLGSSSAQLVTDKAIEFGVGALLHEDPRPVPSDLEGVWPRTWYAVKHTFIARDRDGRPTPAVCRLAGAYGGAFLSNLWYPSRINGPGDALVRGSLSLAGSAGSSIAREFWPDIKRRMLRKKP